MKYRTAYLVIAVLTAVMPLPTLAKALRVVSLSPSLTETICKIGGRKYLVGRSSACDYPAAVKTLPVCGDYRGPALEKLLQVKPDIVVGSMLKDQGVINNIRALGIRFIDLPNKTLADYPVTVKRLGKLLQLQSNAAAEIRRYRNCLAYFKKLAAAIPLRQRPTVLLLIYDRPLMSVGKRSYIDSLITLAGGRNIAAEIDRSYFNCSMEWIMARQPQVIILPHSSSQKVSELCRQPGWNSLNAVRRHRLYYGDHNDKIFRLGPRLTLGLAILYHYFYPSSPLPCRQSSEKMSKTGKLLRKNASTPLK